MGSVIEVADFAAVLNAEYKIGTDDKYLTINVVKRRRIDMAEAEFARYNYLAHPFKKNSIQLIDDMNLDKILSLQSLATDIDSLGISKERTNAVPRLNTMEQKEFDFDDY